MTGVFEPAPNSYFGFIIMDTLYFCVTCNKKFNSKHVSKFQLSVRVREPCLWTAAQFPNSERVSLKRRMIFRVGQFAGRGLVMAFVNWGAASSWERPALSSKTGPKPPLGTEVPPPGTDDHCTMG